MAYNAICPFCGYLLLKAENGTGIEILCPRCKEKFVIEIKENKLIMQCVSKPAPSDDE